MAEKKWVATVNTDSTHPQEHLFNQDAETIAKQLASKKVSPKGPVSGMRMLNYYINRGGKNLSEERHSELEKAKQILSGIIARQKETGAARKASSGKPAARKTTARKSASRKSAARKSVKTSEKS